MDPNANLNIQRELAGRILSNLCEPEEWMDDVATLAELVLALHDWLGKGGFLPDAWLTGRRAAPAGPEAGTLPAVTVDPEAPASRRTPLGQTNAILYRLESGVWVSCGTFALSGLHLFVQADREQSRRSLIQEFGRMLKADIKVRFSDECPACNHVLDTRRSSTGNDGVCGNRACKLAEPSAEDMRPLMSAHPYRRDELAGDYYDRLKNIWRTSK